MGEALRKALEDLSTLLCEFVPRPTEDFVRDFNEFAILVDGWWPETFRNCTGNMVALGGPQNLKRPASWIMPSR